MLPDNLLYLYKGESNQVYTYDSQTHSLQRSKAEDGTRFGNGPRLEIEVKEEESDSGKARINYTRQWDYPPIWNCPNHEMTLVANYIHSNLRISFTYKTATMEEANRFRAEVARLISWQRLVQKLAIEYYIHPDPEIYAIMHHIYKLQESNAGYGISEMDWLLKYASQNSLRKLKTIDGIGRCLAFKERQVEIVGRLDMTEIPEKSKRDQSPGYEIQFDFIVEYEKPFSTTLTYPIVVHNQMIDSVWIPDLQIDNPHYKEEVEHTVLSKGLKTVIGLNHPFENSYTSFHGITRPLGDNWCEPTSIYSHRSVYTALVRVQKYNDDGWMPLFSIEEMSNHLILGNGTYRYICGNLSDCTDPSKSHLAFEVYRFNQRISPNNLKLVKDGDDIILYTNFLFSQRDIIHVCFKRQTRFEEADEELFRKMTNYPDMIEELFGTMVKTLEYRYGFNSIAKEVKNEYTRYNPESSLVDDTIQKAIADRMSNVVKLSFRGEWSKIMVDLMFYRDDDSIRQQSGYTQYILQHFFDWLEQDNPKEWWLSLKHDYDKKYGILKYYQHDLYEWLKQQQTDEQGAIDKWYFGTASITHIKHFLCQFYNPRPEDEKHYINTGAIHYQMYAYVIAQRGDIQE